MSQTKPGTLLRRQIPAIVDKWADMDVPGYRGDRPRLPQQRFQDITRLLVGLDLPVVASVNGVALGGGLVLAAACDVPWRPRAAGSL